MGMDGYLSKPLRKSRLFDELGRLGSEISQAKPAQNIAPFTAARLRRYHQQAS